VQLRASDPTQLHDGHRTIRAVFVVKIRVKNEKNEMKLKLKF
jgi:hypothetical protein